MLAEKRTWIGLDLIDLMNARARLSTLGALGQPLVFENDLSCARFQKGDSGVGRLFGAHCNLFDNNDRGGSFLLQGALDVTSNTTFFSLASRLVVR